MDKKVFLAVSLCAAILLLWQHFYMKPYQQGQQTAPQQLQVQSPQLNAAPAQNSASGAGSKGATPSGANAAVETIKLGSASYHFVVSTKSGAVGRVEFSEFRGQKGSNIWSLVGGGEQLDITTPSPEWLYLSSVNYKIEGIEKAADGFHSKATLTYSDENVSIKRTYTINPSLFSLDHQISFEFRKQPPAYIFVGLKGLRQIPKEQQENERRQIYFNKSGGQETWTVEDIDSVKDELGEGRWMGFSSRYFLNALIDQSETLNPQFQTRPLDGSQVSANLIYKITAPKVDIPLRMYFGPKDLDILNKAGPHLKAAVDFGWFTIFAYPLLTALKWFYKYVHNYGIAIILLTLLVKILTYPLTLKSMKSMKEMQRIQPQLTKLREKHKDDKERLNREMLQLMRANGYNPMSGCLPIFIQMPIFIALYNVLYGAIDLYGQPFFGWIHDLSAKDPYYVTPVLLSLMMFIQQKLTPTTAADPAQQRMMMMMPLIFGLMMLWLPSGLTLYMLVNSIVSIIQQFFMNKSLGIGGARTSTGASAAV
ncbi:MAG: membrane protein insertase YidC [Bdellovibrionota bacterium]